MESRPVRQANFAGGEVSPLFYGNTDHPRYRSSLRKLLNFVALPHGPVQNRPGTRFIAHTKVDGKVLLVPFVFSSTQTYVLEFGNLYVRFYSAGGQLVTGGPPVPYEVATPFTAAMLPYLKFAQSADVMTIDYGGQDPAAAAIAPQELKRLGHTNWTIGAVSYAVLPAYVPAVVLKVLYNGTYPTAADVYNAATTYFLGDYVTESNRIWVSIQNANTGNLPSASAAFWVPAVDTSRPLLTSKWVITTLGKDANGNLFETGPSAAILKDFPLGTDRPLRIAWADPAALYAGPGYTVVGWGVYRARHGIFGWVGDTDAGASEFKDEGQEPDYSRLPPAAADPFALPGGGHDYPSAPAFFEQRRLFARQGLHAQRIQGSKIGQFSNFDPPLIEQADSPVSLDLASLELEEIRSLVPLQSVFVLTQSGVWTLRGFPGQALGPTSVNARKQHHSVGAAWPSPAKVGDGIVYAQDGGGAVWDFFYNALYDVGTSSDVSVWAQHLLEGRTVVQMAYAARPFKVVWVVRDDGVLLGLTYLRSTDPQAPSILAWHQHTTDGLVESIAVVPEGAEDAVYLEVSRAGGRFVERMASRKLPLRTAPDPKDATKTVQIADVRFGVFLDASLQFDGRNVGATTMRVTGASYNADDLVNVEASAASFAAGDINDQLVIDADGTPTRITVTAFTDATHVVGRLEAPLPAAFQNAPTALWGWARDTMTGLDHLNGKAVTALVDGVVQGPLVVLGGMVQLAPPGLIVQAGLPYNSDFELLDIAGDAVKPNVKSVARAIFEVVASRGIYAGQDFDKLRPAKTRKVSDNFGAPALVTDQVAVDTDADWNTGGRAVLRQSDPLPLTIAAVTREVVVGGRG